MDNKAELILEKIADKYHRYNEILNLMEYPEIIADRKYYSFLTREKDSLETIMSSRDKLIEALEEIAVLNSSLFNNVEKDVLQKEIEKVQKKTEEEVKKINKALLFYEEGFKTCEMYFSGSNNIQNEINKIIKAYCIFAANSDINLEKQENKNALRLKGPGNILKKEEGAYKIIVEHISYPLFIRVEDKSNENVVEFNDRDVEFDLLRSSGAGGQNINKVETAVRARHLPTGITVLCQDERSQLKNMNKAIERLKEKVIDSKQKERDLILKEKQKMLMKEYSEGNYKRVYDFDKNRIKQGNKVYVLDEKLGQGLENLI